MSVGIRKRDVQGFCMIGEQSETLGSNKETNRNHNGSCTDGSSLFARSTDGSQEGFENSY